MPTEHTITKWLGKKSPIITTIYLSTFSFLIYACMYGLRKPFAVAEFSGMTLWGMDYKPVLIIAQVVGYSVSKFLGIKVISEMKERFRAVSIVFLTSFAELSLFLFSIVPSPYNIIFLFLNGLPLGMIWGLVFAYLEGRKTTEVLGTALSISFIISSGFVKSAGKMIEGKFNLTDFQMPWVTGLIFLIPLIMFVWFLDKAPAPTAEDEFLRCKRVPMGHKQRIQAFRKFAFGLVLFIIAYMLLTVYRDLRDNFAVEIWKSIGFSGNNMIFTLSEMPVAMIVFLVMTSVMFIRNNSSALQANIIIVLAGFIIIGLSTLLLQKSIINPPLWMILLGLGTYLGYLPFNCLLFDRLIAASGSVANAGFFIYVADSFGYLGSVGTLVFKNFSNKSMSWFNFVVTSSYGVALTGCILMILSLLYFRIRITTGVAGNAIRKTRLDTSVYSYN